MSRDSESLAEHKEQFPVLKSIPDEEFLYSDGRWLMTLKATRQLAFAHQRKDILLALDVAEKEIKGGN